MSCLIVQPSVQIVYLVTMHRATCQGAQASLKVGTARHHGAGRWWDAQLRQQRSDARGEQCSARCCYLLYLRSECVQRTWQLQGLDHAQLHAGSFRRRRVALRARNNSDSQGLSSGEEWYEQSKREARKVASKSTVREQLGALRSYLTMRGISCMPDGQPMCVRRHCAAPH
jgi:hypothetical protein